MQPLFVSQNGQLWSLVKYTENFLRSFPSRLGSVSLQYLWSFFTLPAHIETKGNTQVKTGKKKKGVVEVLVAEFRGRVNHHDMDEGQATTNCYFTRNITLQQLKHHLLILFSKVVFFCPLPSHLHLPISSSSSCYFSQKKQRNETHNKLQFKMFA